MPGSSGRLDAAIVFDLDGTLIDSAPDLQQVANTLLQREGAPPISLAEARSFIGNGAPVFVARMCEARGIDGSHQERLLADFMAAYETAVNLTLPYPGVPQALQALRRAGAHLAVCTNKPLHATRAVLAHLGLEEHFAAILGGDSLPQRKPDPAPLQAAFARLEGTARLYVGDSEIDAETAHRAGVPFLLFTQGYRKSPVEALVHAAAFSDFAELPELIGTFA